MRFIIKLFTLIGRQHCALSKALLFHAAVVQAGSKAAADGAAEGGAVCVVGPYVGALVGMQQEPTFDAQTLSLKNNKSLTRGSLKMSTRPVPSASLMRAPG